MGPFVWCVCALAFGGLSTVGYLHFRAIWQLMPVQKRPPESSLTPWLPLIAMGFLLAVGVWWAGAMQSSLLPKLFHSFSHPEHTSVHFISEGGIYSRFRDYQCPRLRVMTARYGEVLVCVPDGLRDRVDRKVSGALGGTESIYGFWVERMFIDPTFNGTVTQ